MIEIITKISGNDQLKAIIPKDKKHLFKNRDTVKIIKLKEVTEDEDKFRSWYWETTRYRASA